MHCRMLILAEGPDWGSQSTDDSTAKGRQCVSDYRWHSTKCYVAKDYAEFRNHLPGRVMAARIYQYRTDQRSATTS